jgi:hypothetical protein
MPVDMKVMLDTAGVATVRKMKRGISSPFHTAVPLLFICTTWTLDSGVMPNCQVGDVRKGSQVLHLPVPHVCIG